MLFILCIGSFKYKSATFSSVSADSETLTGLGNISYITIIIVYLSIILIII
jgi:hypothetical protein